MKFWKLSQLNSFVLSLILGLPLLTAGLIKFINPSDFASSLKYSFTFPDWLSILLSIIIPPAEMVIGISLIVNLYRNKLLILYRILLISFLLFHIWQNIISDVKPCNCFGNLLELSGIWMMFIIIILVLVSFLPLINRSERKPNNSIPLNFSRTNIILVVCIAATILTGGYVRWLRIDRELNTGLISHTEIPEVREKLHTIYLKHFSKTQNNKSTLLLILRGKLCRSCLDELLFWNNNNVVDKINILVAFRDFNEKDIEKYKKAYSIKLNVMSLEENVYYKIIGKYPDLINRILYTPKGEVSIAVSTTDDYKEKKHFLSSLNHKINNQEKE